MHSYEFPPCGNRDAPRGLDLSGVGTLLRHVPKYQEMAQIFNLHIVLNSFISSEGRIPGRNKSVIHNFHIASYPHVSVLLCISFSAGLVTQKRTIVMCTSNACLRDCSNTFTTWYHDIWKYPSSVSPNDIKTSWHRHQEVPRVSWQDMLREGISESRNSSKPWLLLFFSCVAPCFMQEHLISA